MNPRSRIIEDLERYLGSMSIDEEELNFHFIMLIRHANLLAYHVGDIASCSEKYENM